MKQCKSPIYHVMDTIAKHSEELSVMLNNWKDTFDESEYDDSFITAVTNMNQDVNDLYLCDTPLQEPV